MTYEEALTYVHSVSWRGSRPGLERISDLMARLGNPERAGTYLHVVGTNGKGSTAAMLQSVLTAAGYRTGLFTSPHLVDFRERMQIDGELIAPAALADLTARLRPVADAMPDPPTEFELVTALALTWFANSACDFVVLEAGMGGALDATNVIPAPAAAIFTNIGLDHTEYLGGTVEEIAATKAGIVKPGCFCVYYPNTPAVERTILAACEAQAVPAFRAPVEELRRTALDLGGQSFQYRGRTFRLPLLGDHQLANAAVVLQTVEGLRARGCAISEDAVCKGLAHTVWPGRFEVLRKDPLFLLDGGHNPQCIQALAGALHTCLPGRTFTVLTGVLEDKDYLEMYRPLLPLTNRFVTVTPDSPRALPAFALAAWLKQYGKPTDWCDTVEEGVRQAEADGDPVLACGSLYLAGEIRGLAQWTIDN